MNNEIADLQWDRDRHIAANAVLKVEIERRGDRITVLEELLVTTRASTGKEESMFIIREGIKDLVTLCHSRSKAAGWWDGQDWARDANVVAAKLALIHSEISEALEGARKGIMDDHLPHRTMFEVELADAVIRICDLAGATEIDLGAAVAEKLEYNRTRKDHTREARAAAGGKKI